MKYKKAPLKTDIDSLRIEINKKGNRIVGFTVWAGKFWVLDGSVMLDRGEESVRVFTGNRNNNLQFEYIEGRGYPLENYLELRRKA